MIRTRTSAALAGAVLAALTAGAQAAPLQVSGDSVLLRVSDDGTIGDGNALPALVYDPTGTGTFDTSTDYVAPGDPFEAFGFRSDQTGFIYNDNSVLAGSISSSEGFNLTSLTDLSGGTFDNHLRWVGESKDGSVGVSHDFYFDDDEERVNIRTVLIANVDLTGVSFARATDPDPDNIPGGTAATNNDRGLDLNNDGDFDDAGEVAPGDLVTSVGQVSLRPLGLYSNSSVAHQTGIEASCCSVSDPLQYLAGGDFASVAGFDSTGDNGIGIAFDIGSLAAGTSIILDYAYVMGLTFETIDIPDDPVPGPATLGLAGMALGSLALRARRRRA
jgi:hypothetical protein